MYWFYILPLGFLLTMYTITGYDASAHISEETHGAEHASAKGVWRSRLLLGGLRLDRAAGDHLRVQKSTNPTICKAGFPALAIFDLRAAARPATRPSS